MSNAPSPESASVAEQIIQSAFELAKDKGFSALSSRSVAAAARVSPSAIIYYFGGILEVKRLVANAARDAVGQWRIECQQSGEKGLTAPSPSGVLMGALLDLVLRNRDLAILHLELLGIDETYARQEREAGKSWSRTFEKYGASPEIAVTWTDLFYGLVSFVLLDSSPMSVASWLPLLVERVSDRIERRPSFSSARFPFPDAAPSPPAPTTSGAQKILNAAVELIAEIGVDNLTLRLVASRAGLSLASTTYFFESKSALIVEAANELHRRRRKVVQEGVNKVPEVSLMLGDDGTTLSVEIRATYAMHAPAARHPELGEVRALLRDMRGPLGVLKWLKKLSVSDPLDSVIWTTLMFGMIHPVRIPRRNVVMALQERFDLHRANLFRV